MKENAGIYLNSDGPLPQRWHHLPVVFFSVKTGMAHCHNGGTIYPSTMKENVGICLNSDGPLPQRWLHLPVVVLLYGDTYAPKPRGNSLPAIRYEPHMKTSQSIAANCLRRIACGELPAANCLFFVKKTKDNRTWVADQEPVNMKRLEP